MKRARNRRPRQRASRAAADPSSAQFDEENGLGSLGTSMSRKTTDWKPPDGHVVRPAILHSIMTFLHAKQQTAL
jgi:hypothetical protein